MLSRDARNGLGACHEAPQCRTSGIAFSIRERIPVPESINPRNDYGKFAIYAKETSRLNFGRQVIDLTDLEQLLEWVDRDFKGIMDDLAPSEKLINELRLPVVKSQKK